MSKFGSLHYNSIAPYLKEQFGCRVIKLSLDAGLTCPNRDGTCGFGGCSFCSGAGSGDFAGTAEQQKKLMEPKWGTDNKYIAYFQNFTNTHADPTVLRLLWDDALSDPDVVGLAIATRPDCIDWYVLDLLDEFNKKTFLWVELGLQTENEKTAESFNRCYKNEAFELAMKNLTDFGIRTVVHLILGFRGEDKAQFERSVDYVCSFKPFGIKIHMLNILKGTAMAEEYAADPWPLLSREEYIKTVADLLERIPPEVTVHRLTGDGPSDLLIAPQWVTDKHAVLNGLQQEFADRGTEQGVKADIAAAAARVFRQSAENEKSKPAERRHRFFASRENL